MSDLGVPPSVGAMLTDAADALAAVRAEAVALAEQLAEARERLWNAERDLKAQRRVCEIIAGSRDAESALADQLATALRWLLKDPHSRTSEDVALEAVAAWWTARPER